MSYSGLDMSTCKGLTSIKCYPTGEGDQMPVYALAFPIGMVAGLRSMTAPAVVSWGARLGWLHVDNTGLAFLGSAITSNILSLLAVGELMLDKLPKTPSRKSLVPFAGRVITGGLCGAALGAPRQALIGGLLSGMFGAAAGTLGGYEIRTRVVKATGGKDRPVALIEDAVAICGALVIVSRVS